MRYLRTNTATRITVGPFLDVTNGYAAETGLTATNEALTFIVDTGGVPTLVLDTTATASGGNNDMVHITNDNAGYYDLELTAAQTNYLGRAMLTIQYDTDHRPVTHEFMIVPANVYDSLVLGSATDYLQVDVTQLLGTAWLTPLNAGTPDVNVRQISTDTTAADNCELFFDGTGYAGTNNVIPTVTSSGLSAAAVDAIWDETVTGHVTASSYGKYLDSDISAKADSLTFTVTNKLDANVDTWNGNAVTAPAIAGSPVVTLNATQAAYAPAKAGDAMTLSTGAITSTTVATGAIDADAIATDAVAEIVDAVWDELALGHTTTGTYGKYLDSDISAEVALLSSGIGSLAITYTLTLSDNGLPIANARVWISTDASHANIVASGTTDALGVVGFDLDPGTYYFWRYKSGVNFTNPLSGTFSSGVTTAVGTGALVDTISSARIKTVTYVGSI